MEETLLFDLGAKYTGKAGTLSFTLEDYDGTAVLFADSDASKTHASSGMYVRELSVGTGQYVVNCTEWPEIANWPVTILVWDSSTLVVAGLLNAETSNVIQVDGNESAADNLSYSARSIVVITAVAGTLTVTQMTTDLTEATNNHYVGRALIGVTGALAGQGSTITAYDGSSKMLTFNSMTDAATADDIFVIV